VKDLIDLFEAGSSAGQIADRIKISRSTVSKWISGETATIDRHMADKYATLLGMHPSEIWGNAWWQIPFKETSIVNSIDMLDIEDDITENA
jgi:transcriptional regulator with XRE-family HTH domain